MSCPSKEQGDGLMSRPGSHEVEQSSFTATGKCLHKGIFYFDGRSDKNIITSKSKKISKKAKKELTI